MDRLLKLELRVSREAAEFIDRKQEEAGEEEKGSERD
jgi:hypothetical protein